MAFVNLKNIPFSTPGAQSNQTSVPAVPAIPVPVAPQTTATPAVPQTSASVAPVVPNSVAAPSSSAEALVAKASELAINPVSGGASTTTVTGAMPVVKTVVKNANGKKKIHTYKLIVASIIGTVAALSFYSMYKSMYSYVFVTYEAGDTLPLVDLNKYALERVLTEKELLQQALRYKYIPQEAALRAVAMQVQTLSTLDYKNWKKTIDELQRYQIQTEAEIKMELRTKYVLSDAHEAHIVAHIASGALDAIVIPLDDAKQKAYVAVELYKNGTKASIIEAYILFSIAAGLQNESAFIAAQALGSHLESKDLIKADEQIAAELQTLGVAVETLHAAPIEPIVDPIVDPIVESSSSSSVSEESASSMSAESVSSIVSTSTPASSSVTIIPVASSSASVDTTENIPQAVSESSADSTQSEAIESVSSSAALEPIRFNKRRIRDVSNINNIQ